jgi:hypothetical protein
VVRMDGSRRVVHAEELLCAAIEQWPSVVRAAGRPCGVRVEEWRCVAHIAWAAAITEASGTVPAGIFGTAGGGRMGWAAVGV